MDQKANRRRFFKLGMVALASAPFLKIGKVFADGDTCKVTKPTDEAVLNRMVKEDDPAAKRLDYIEVATDSKHPNFKPGELCKNCRFYRHQQEKDGWAPCTMLANRYVTACGWCRSYQPMPS